MPGQERGGSVLPGLLLGMTRSPQDLSVLEELCDTRIQSGLRLRSEIG